ncbi:hypothetical protein SASPL_149089 [Salvia splendens]|uniref:Xylanase inhibitor C-terminal domain-containing protein n=1 Tax=Salvia splendens TaxID=180675 RepID=A0A8X8WA90_SALSN|nr:hypothetical protein SASPL_149089 [Salvia splendens]
MITRLPPAAYSALSAAFKKGMKKYPAASAFSILDTCYDLSNYTSISIPTVSFTFDDAADNGIFGNTQQLAFEVVYDVAGGKLGFAAAGC